VDECKPLVMGKPVTTDTVKLPSAGGAGGDSGGGKGKPRSAKPAPAAASGTPTVGRCKLNR